MIPPQELTYVSWFRTSTPYINAHRGRTFVVWIEGEAVADARFPNIIHDLALLNSLGIKLVLVHGARPQINTRLQQLGVAPWEQSGPRVTDDTALQAVKEAVGAIRMEIEALLSMGLANSPMAGAHIRVNSGNYVVARPYGIHQGVDYRYTGEIRRIDTEAIKRELDHGAMVLLPPVGYSPTGEIFNLSAAEVATLAAIHLKADKLICLSEGAGVLDDQGQLIHELSLLEAENYLQQTATPLEQLPMCVRACRQGVRRAHVIGRDVDGGLLLELFTRNGVGTLINADVYDTTRTATIEDVGGILELIQPLETDGTLVRRSREKLEMEIEHFSVMERDGMIIACAALYPFAKDNFAEVACMVVQPGYQGAGRGDDLLGLMEQKALSLGISRIFVLTVRTAHWFLERGFVEADLAVLPMQRQGLYNYQRKSKIFMKTLNGKRRAK
ncbi:MAG: amino-acid N-acetyltransferase [Pseudomonadota bacterium]